MRVTFDIRFYFFASIHSFIYACIYTKKTWKHFYEMICFDSMISLSLAFDNSQLRKRENNN